MKMQTIEDAITAWINSGYLDWKFPKAFDEEDFVMLFWKTEDDTQRIGPALKRYLVSLGEDLNDYDF